MEMPLTNQRPAGAGAVLGAQRTPRKQRQRREGAPRSKEWRRGAAGSSRRQRGEAVKLLRSLNLPSALLCCGEQLEAILLHERGVQPGSTRP